MWVHSAVEYFFFFLLNNSNNRVAEFWKIQLFLAVGTDIFAWQFVGSKIFVYRSLRGSSEFCQISPKSLQTWDYYYFLDYCQLFWDPGSWDASCSLNTMALKVTGPPPQKKTRQINNPTSSNRYSGQVVTCTSQSPSFEIMQNMFVALKNIKQRLRTALMGKPQGEGAQCPVPQTVLEELVFFMTVHLGFVDWALSELNRSILQNIGLYPS